MKFQLSLSDCLCQTLEKEEAEMPAITGSSQQRISGGLITKNDLKSNAEFHDVGFDGHIKVAKYEGHMVTFYKVIEDQFTPSRRITDDEALIRFRKR